MNFHFILASVAADSFPFSGGVEIEANEKRASEGARLGSPHRPPSTAYFATLSQFSSRSRAFGKGKETAATQTKFIWKTSLQIQNI